MTDKAPKRPRRPRDINQLARQVVDEAVIGDGAIAKSASSGKNIGAVELGRRGGIKGGKARARKLSPERRAEIARQAASARWSAKSDDNRGGGSQ